MNLWNRTPRIERHSAIHVTYTRGDGKDERCRLVDAWYTEDGELIVENDPCSDEGKPKATEYLDHAVNLAMEAVERECGFHNLRVPVGTTEAGAEVIASGVVETAKLRASMRERLAQVITAIVVDRPLRNER